MAYEPLTEADFESAFPNSQRVYVEGASGVRVPMREIALGGGEPPLRVYDASGPKGWDVHVGLPALRQAWIEQRKDTDTEEAQALVVVAGVRQVGEYLRPAVGDDGPEQVELVVAIAIAAVGAGAKEADGP